MKHEIRDAHIAEMTNINLSLHTLGRCISSLAARSLGKVTASYLPRTTACAYACVEEITVSHTHLRTLPLCCYYGTGGARAVPRLQAHPPAAGQPRGQRAHLPHRHRLAVARQRGGEHLHPEIRRPCQTGVSEPFSDPLTEALTDACLLLTLVLLSWWAVAPCR